MALLPEFDLIAALAGKPPGSERDGATTAGTDATAGTDGTQCTDPGESSRSSDIIWIPAVAAASIEPLSGQRLRTLTKHRR